MLKKYSQSTDSVWLKDPRPYIDLVSKADVFISTDCRSPTEELKVDLNQKIRGGEAQCGHLPGEISHRLLEKAFTENSYSRKAAVY